MRLNSRVTSFIVFSELNTICHMTSRLPFRKRKTNGPINLGAFQINIKTNKIGREKHINADKFKWNVTVCIKKKKKKSFTVLFSLL